MSDLIILVLTNFLEGPTHRTYEKLDVSWLPETFLFFSRDSLRYPYVTNYTFSFTTKLALCLVFLSAIKGGVPRYRYDFLTKMGWVKFLGLMLSVFLLVFLLFTFW